MKTDDDYGYDYDDDGRAYNNNNNKWMLRLQSDARITDVESRIS